MCAHDLRAPAAPRPIPWPRALLLDLGIAAVYLLAGRVGLALASYGHTASLLWAPTGLSLAAVVVGGPRLLPAVWLGAFLTNGHLDPALAALIATGNVLEASAGAWLIRRTGVDPALRRVRDVLLFLAWCAVASLVSATFGTLAVVLGEAQARAAPLSVWIVWWAGNTTGAITIAPLLMNLWSPRARSTARGERRLEGAGLATGTLLATAIAFGADGQLSVAGALAAFPLLAWASLRFGAREATAVLAWLACAVIVGTAVGRGPFLANGAPDPVAAWVYLCGLAVTGLLVTALAGERDAALEHLRRQAHELKRADRCKDEFLAMLGHELRNPLAAVAAGTRVLRHPAATEQQRGWALGALDRQVAQLASLVDDLLDLTRVSRGRIALHRQPVDLRQVVAHAERAVRPALEERGHTLDVGLPEQDLVLDADPSRVEQVLVNLLTNAARYTPPGGKLALVVERGEGEARVSVTDTGAGLTPEDLAHVFEPFYQGSAGRAATGLGLGLALVSQLVALHGGRVSAESEGPGKGSTFRVSFPLAAPAARPAEPQRAARGAGMAGLRVLVVDDNVDAATGLRLLLEERGAEVVTAEDGRSGLAAAARFAPRIALVDLGLPDLPGYEVARELRRNPATRDLPIVAVTGFGTDGTRRAAAEAGFTTLLVKPVRDEELLEVVERLTAPPIAPVAVPSLPAWWTSTRPA